MLAKKHQGFPIFSSSILTGPVTIGSITTSPVRYSVKGTKQHLARHQDNAGVMAEG